jgi:hypothetical protein
MKVSLYFNSKNTLWAFIFFKHFDTGPGQKNGRKKYPLKITFLPKRKTFSSPAKFFGHARAAKSSVGNND